MSECPNGDPYYSEFWVNPIRCRVSGRLCRAEGGGAYQECFEYQRARAVAAEALAERLHIWSEQLLVLHPESLQCLPSIGGVDPREVFAAQKPVAAGACLPHTAAEGKEGGGG
jgi:hypothetical protein